MEEKDRVLTAFIRTNVNWRQYPKVTIEFVERFCSWRNPMKHLTTNYCPYACRGVFEECSDCWNEEINKVKEPMIND